MVLKESYKYHNFIRGHELRETHEHGILINSIIQIHTCSYYIDIIAAAVQPEKKKTHSCSPFYASAKMQICAIDLQTVTDVAAFNCSDVS